VSDMKGIILTDFEIRLLRKVIRRHVGEGACGTRDKR
jgi:hypothetical protein